MISVGRLTKRFSERRDSVLAADDLSIDIEEGNFFTLLGPSGCGKTTLLRCIAGLESPDAGEIRIGGELVFSSVQAVNIPTNRRPIGMVFQSYAIWPHMTVFENVAFPLQMRRLKGVRARVADALAMVELENLSERYASQLSGGQQQRVAFARAIVAEPKVLLLDEPLSNLDATLRQHMAMQLRSLHDKLRITTVYVTHDQTEALSLSNKIAVMSQGKIVETGSPEELYFGPRLLFTAQFVGDANILQGRSSSQPDSSGLIPIETAIGPLWAAGPGKPGSVTILIRPENIRIVPAEDRGVDSPCGKNVFSCTVQQSRFFGESRELQLVFSAGKPALRCRMPGNVRIRTGESIFIQIEPRHIDVLHG